MHCLEDFSGAIVVGLWWCHEVDTLDICLGFTVGEILGGAVLADVDNRMRMVGRNR